MYPPPRRSSERRGVPFTETGRCVRQKPSPSGCFCFFFFLSYGKILAALCTTAQSGPNTQHGKIQIELDLAPSANRTQGERRARACCAVISACGRPAIDRPGVIQHLRIFISTRCCCCCFQHRSLGTNILRGSGTVLASTTERTVP